MISFIWNSRTGELLCNKLEQLPSIEVCGFAEKECTWGNFLDDGNNVYHVKNKGSG